MPHLDMPMTAALLAPYARRFLSPLIDEHTDDMLTMEQLLPSSSICNLGVKLGIHMTTVKQDCLAHVGNECLAHFVDGLDVELEALVPLGLGAVEDGALVHESSAVEQHVDILQT